MTEFLGENERSLARVYGAARPVDRLIDRVTQFLQRRERPHRRLEASSRGGSTVEPQPTSQIIVHVMGHAHRIEPTGNNKVEGGLSKPIYGD
ncbi:hypothetical protein ALC57_11271 [Trachymyrmex cornetzi]|uniref:Uncharacterized protein n=1 Tax=Trachymyrmex cornetzi TaxID=471704 RepID=A0A195DU68_9HYME|nr:hypothetical protein ALC57_11271 [Trachymyrmex cornetzi]